MVLSLVGEGSAALLQASAALILAPALVHWRALAAELHLAGTVLVPAHGGGGVHGPARQRGRGRVPRRRTAVAVAVAARVRVDHRGGGVHGPARKVHQRGVLLPLQRGESAAAVTAAFAAGEEAVQVDAERGELRLVLLDKDEVDGLHPAPQLLGIGARARGIVAM